MAGTDRFFSRPVPLISALRGLICTLLLMGSCLAVSADDAWLSLLLTARILTASHLFDTSLYSVSEDVAPVLPPGILMEPTYPEKFPAETDSPVNLTKPFFYIFKPSSPDTLPEAAPQLAFDQLSATDSDSSAQVTLRFKSQGFLHYELQHEEVIDSGGEPLSGENVRDHIVIFWPGYTDDDPEPEPVPPPDCNDEQAFFAPVPAIPFNHTLDEQLDPFSDLQKPSLLPAASDKANLQSALLIHINDDNITIPYGFLVDEGNQLRLITVNPELSRYLQELKLDADITLESIEELRIADLTETSLTGQPTSILEGVGQLLAGLGLLRSVIWKNDEMVYVYLDAEGRLRTTTQAEYMHLLSLWFEAELEYCLYGSSCCSQPPEQYRNGYTLPSSMTGNSLYHNWCEANAFSRSDGHACWRHTARKSLLRQHAEWVHRNIAPGISVEDILKKITQASKRKKDKKADAKKNGEQDAIKEQPHAIQAVSAGAISSYNNGHPLHATPVTIDDHPVAQSELFTFLKLPDEAIQNLLFLTGLTPEQVQVSASARKTETFKGYLKNASGKLPAARLYENLLRYINTPEECYLKGQQDRLTEQQLIKELQTHYSDNFKRADNIFRHFQYFHLGIIEYKEAILSDCPGCSDLEFHTLFWQRFRSAYLRLPATSRIFDPIVKRAPSLGISFFDDLTKTRMMLDLLEVLLQRHQLVHYWPLLALNLGLRIDDIQAAMQSCRQASLENPCLTALSDVLSKALSQREGFLDPMELALALTQSGLSIIASLMGLPGSTLEAQPNPTLLIRFTKEPLPAAWMASGSLAKEISSLLTELDSDPPCPEDSLTVQLENEPEYFFYELNQCLLNNMPFAGHCIFDLLRDRSAVTIRRDEKRQPDFITELPLASHYLGALVPSNLQRQTLRGISLISSAIRMVEALHHSCTLSGTIIEVNWHHPETDHSHLVFYSRPGPSQGGPADHLRTTVRKLFLEWLFQEHISSENQQTLAATLQKLTTDGESPFSEMMGFLVEAISRIEDPELSNLPDRLVELRGWAEQFESANHEAWKKLHSTSDATDLQLFTMVVIARKLVFETLLPSPVIQWPELSPRESQGLNHFFIAQSFRPTVLQGFHSEQSLTHTQQTIPPDDSAHAIVPGLSDALLIRSGSRARTDRLSLVSAGEIRWLNKYGSIHSGQKENRRALEFFPLPDEEYALPSILDDFEQWAIHQRLAYLKRLITAIESTQAFQVPLYKENLLVDDINFTEPSIITGPGGLAVATEQASALAQLVLEIIFGKALDADSLAKLSQFIRFLPQHCLTVIPPYARRIIEFMYLAQWLPDAEIPPRLEYYQLLKGLLRLLEDMDDPEAYPLVHQSRLDDQPQASATLVSSLPKVFSYSLPPWLDHHMTCLRSALFVPGNNPNHLASLGLLNNGKGLNCISCSAKLQPYIGWANLAMAHWFQAQGRCALMNERLIMIAPQQIPDLLLTCADSGNNLATSAAWINQKITDYELTWIADHSEATLNWERVAYLSGASLESIKKSRNMGFRGRLRKLFGHYPSHRKFFIALKQAGIDGAELLLPHFSTIAALQLPEDIDKRLLKLRIIDRLQKSHGQAGLPELQQLREALKTWPGAPEWAVYVKALNKEHPPVLNWLLKSSLDACQRLLPDLPGKSTERFVTCIVTLAEQHQLNHYWPLLGYLMGHGRNFLLKTARLENDSERLRAVLMQFIKANDNIPDPETLGQLLGSSGMLLVARLLHLPWQINGSPGPTAMITGAVRQLVSNHLSDQTGLFSFRKLKTIYEGVPDTVAESIGANEPALMMHYENLQLGSNLLLETHCQVSCVDNTWQPGFFSNLPATSAIQAWWLLPRKTLVPGDLANLISQIQSAIERFRLSYPRLQENQIKLTTSHMQDDSHFLQVILYTVPGLATDQPVKIEKQLAHILLQSFTGHSLPLEQVADYFQKAADISGVIHDSGQFNELYKGLIPSLSEWLYCSISDTPCTLTLPELLEEFEHATLPKDFEPPAFDVELYSALFAQCGSKESAEILAQGLNDIGLLPGRSIQVVEEGKIILNLKLLPAVLRAMLAQGFLHNLPEQPFALQVYLPAAANYFKTSTPNPSWLTIIGHLSSKPVEQKVSLFWWENGGIKKTSGKLLASARLPITETGGRELQLFTVPPGFEPVAGQHSWPADSRAGFLPELRTLLEKLQQEGFNINAIQIHQVMMLRRSSGKELPAVLLTEQQQAIPVPPPAFNLQLALDILSVDPAPTISVQPGYSQLEQLLQAIPLAPRIKAALLSFIRPSPAADYTTMAAYQLPPPLTIMPAQACPTPLYNPGLHQHPLFYTTQASLMRYCNYVSDASCHRCEGSIETGFHCLACPEIATGELNCIDFCQGCVGLNPVPTELNYQRRLQSFQSCWSPVNARALATAGFTARVNDAGVSSVVCGSCKLNVADMSGLVDVQATHRCMSPRCPIARSLWPLLPLREAVAELVHAINEAARRQPEQASTRDLVEIGKLVLAHLGKYPGDATCQRYQAGELSEENLLTRLKELEINRAKECPVCLSAWANTPFEPCGHKACAECCQRITEQGQNDFVDGQAVKVYRCPICKRDLKKNENK